MKLRVFSVVGEALHFGARRMETIMRVAWLPASLILILQMATVFTLLSVIAGRFISFADIASFAHAQAALQRHLLFGLMQNPWPLVGVGAASAVLEFILVASFMAPLIRLAGLGEEPAPGVVRVAFGGDQLRYIAASLLSILVMAIFIFGPMAAAAFYTVKYILEAIAEMQFVRFPDPDSLHTIELVPAGQVFFDVEALKPLSRNLPLMVAAPFAIGFWVMLVRHFHPRNRGQEAARANIIARAALTLAAILFFGGLLWSYLTHLAPPLIAAILALAALILYYANLRITPYVGVAVCRRSLAPGNTLRVTRGFNLLRLVGVLILMAVVIFCVQIAINSIAFPAVAATVNSLFAATDLYAKFVSGGEEGSWVRPLFVSVWNGVKILANLFWTFFSYGVVAGYLGRLYRESEEIAGPAPAWRR